MDRFMTLDEVLTLVPFTRQGLRNMAERGEFPRPKKIGKRTIAFRESEVQEWLDNREEAWK